MPKANDYQSTLIKQKSPGLINSSRGDSHWQKYQIRET